MSPRRSPAANLQRAARWQYVAAVLTALPLLLTAAAALLAGLAVAVGLLWLLLH